MSLSVKMIERVTSAVNKRMTEINAIVKNTMK